ncbi:hypothetical protein DFJ77DRAFT_448893 [Powellomyces hirtus]|nr:hypothetical protein DFJ77DRAFT_448893 [Powellomyces hirtus]
MCGHFGLSVASSGLGTPLGVLLMTLVESSCEPVDLSTFPCRWIVITYTASIISRGETLGATRPRWKPGKHPPISQREACSNVDKILPR